MTPAAGDGVPEPLASHLRRQLGEWPPRSRFSVTTTPARDEAGWDGRTVAVLGLATPDMTVVAVSSDLHARAARASSLEELGEILGGRLVGGVFRWADRSAGLEALGAWLPTGDPIVPDWLHPFGGEVLVAVEDGRYVAGVGLKRHDEDVWEIAVGTDEAARGRGLARRLVATATRRVVEEGRTPTYLHDPSNTASARVADAAGFPDRGWRMLFLAPGA